MIFLSHHYHFAAPEFGDSANFHYFCDRATSGNGCDGTSRDVDDTEERFCGSIEQTTPVHSRTCQETVELILPSVYQCSELVAK